MISLLHPSRSRPDKAYQTFNTWSERAAPETQNIDYILSLDYSDPLISEYDHKYNGLGFTIANGNKSVVEATNRASKESKGDILVYLSDDFDCPVNWDRLIEKEFEGVTEPMLLKVDDCLQPFSQRVVTIPIMNRALYERLGYFWYPDYLSMFVDCDLFETCDKQGWIKNAPHLKFPHLHHSIGKAQNDDTYKRSEANWNQGQEVFKRRRAYGFPI